MKTKRIFSILVPALAAAFLWTAAASAAIDKVRCILWQGDPAKHHTAISGQATQLKGVITTDSTATIWYRWNFGDGSAPSTVTALSGATKYNVQIDHTYTGAVGTPFTAQLQVDPVDSSMANAVSDSYLVKIEENNLDAKVNIAIDRGLWYLYTNPWSNSSCQTLNNTPFMLWYNGSSYTGNFFASPAASTIHAFAINNHKINGNTAEDPYVESVRLGMNWLIQGYYINNSYTMLKALPIGLQSGNNPDANSNGYGIEVKDYGYQPIYQSGQIMDAIIASGVQPGDDTGRDFTGRGATWTYGELLQDMCDMYAYGQSESGSYRGGWQYNWNAASDNSAAQWAAIGMIPAQKAPWNCVVPGWVKTENAIWLNTTYNAGHFGYTSANYQHDYYHNTTPSGMVQMNMDGQVGYDDPGTPADERDIKWIACEKYIADNWIRFLTMNSYSWGGPLTYGWYAFAKAMRTAVPSAVERISTTSGVSIDWYNGTGSTMGMAQRIVESQYAQGYWNGSLTGTSPLTTAWMIIILKPALFKTAPIACFTAHPNPSYADQPIAFDPGCSGHSETGKDIANLTKFEWDWDNDGVYDQSTTAPDEVAHAFSCASLPCTYPVTLRVTDDDEEGLTATYTLDINITNPPHPPVADAGGPYIVSTCPGDMLTLDGSKSFDPNEGEKEAGCATCPDDAITAWEWDLSGAPWDYTDASGATPNVDPSTLPLGVTDIGLKVTDNTALSFPTSGEPNLTDEDFGEMRVYEGCICDLTAKSKRGKIQLNWTHTGAASYDIYRGTGGPNGPFVKIADDHVTTYALYLDTGLVQGTKYYYRVATSDGCWSNAASATP